MLPDSSEVSRESGPQARTPRENRGRVGRLRQDQARRKTRPQRNLTPVWRARRYAFAMNVADSRGLEGATRETTQAIVAGQAPVTYTVAGQSSGTGRASEAVLQPGEWWNERLSDGGWRQKRDTPEFEGGYEAGLEWSSALVGTYGAGRRWRGGMKKLLLALNEWLKRNNVGRGCMGCNDLDVLSFVSSQWLVEVESRCRTSDAAGLPLVSPSMADVALNCLSACFRLLGRDGEVDPCQSSRVRSFRRAYREYSLQRGVVEESAVPLRFMIRLREVSSEGETFLGWPPKMVDSYDRVGQDVRQGFLFRPMRGGGAISGGAFNKGIEKWFGEAGVYAGESGHNFRVGGVQAGIGEGWSLGEIMRQGTWSSVGTFMRYGYGMKRGWKRQRGGGLGDKEDGCEAKDCGVGGCEIDPGAGEAGELGSGDCEPVLDSEGEDTGIPGGALGGRKDEYAFTMNAAASRGLEGAAREITQAIVAGQAPVTYTVAGQSSGTGRASEAVLQPGQVGPARAMTGRMTRVERSSKQARYGGSRGLSRFVVVHLLPLYVVLLLHASFACAIAKAKSAGRAAGNTDGSGVIWQADSRSSSSSSPLSTHFSEEGGGRHSQGDVRSSLSPFYATAAAPRANSSAQKEQQQELRPLLPDVNSLFLLGNPDAASHFKEWLAGLPFPSPSPPLSTRHSRQAPVVVIDDPSRDRPCCAGVNDDEEEEGERPSERASGFRLSPRAAVLKPDSKAGRSATSSPGERMMSEEGSGRRPTSRRLTSQSQSNPSKGSKQATAGVSLRKRTAGGRQQNAGSRGRLSTIVVDKNGDGHYTTVQAAVNSVPMGNSRRITIQIKSGVYREKIRVVSGKNFISFKGDGVGKTVLTWGDNARTKDKAPVKGGKGGTNEYGTLGTFESASVAVSADHFTAEDLTIQNTAPRAPNGAVGMQAVALRVSGDMVALHRVALFSWQDTLYAHKGRQFYKDCWIHGSIDFICGSAKALFRNCILYTRGPGSISAQKGGAAGVSDDTGFVFLGGKVLGESGAKDIYLGSFLGRAWGPKALTVFAKVYLANVIKPQGWFDWDDPSRRKKVFFAEYQCYGPGANRSKRVWWSKSLSAKEAKPYLTSYWVGTWIPRW
ncbi:hypothetical protein CBR_g61514 [Chara braunii]|uniref:pectinesterase n=1 Tax=Chara braunii TaxID=69332 RepID=A0A388K8W5_CHABU|nr:hypothetical protein CBR_g61514 [Chara braunii]|eukprot:GBG66471.1 hypothetical protein CBR_g61514 [Chara braunii]